MISRRVIKDTDEEIIIEADTRGFGYFVVTNSDEVVVDDGVDDDSVGDEQDVTNDDTPGFGVVVALIALVLAVIAIRVKS